MKNEIFSCPKISQLVIRYMTVILDSEKPQIECPRPQQYVNEENTNYREIDLKEATATDNSNLPVTITMSHSSPLKVSVDNSVDVTYTAVDAAGNVKKCTSQYIVIGMKCYH